MKLTPAQTVMVTQIHADGYSVKFSADTTVDMLEAFAADQNLERGESVWR